MVEQISEKHQRIAGLLMRNLKNNHGSVNTKIKAREIMAALKLRGYSVDDGELRSIIGHIRRNDLCAPGFILSDPGGYWYSENLEDMEPVLETEYGRALKIMLNFRPLRRRIRHLLAGKNSLFNSDK